MKLTLKLLLLLFGYLVAIEASKFEKHFSLLEHTCEVHSLKHELIVDSELSHLSISRLAFTHCFIEKGAQILQGAWTPYPTMKKDLEMEFYKSLLNSRIGQYNVLAMFTRAIEDMYYRENIAIISEHLCKYHVPEDKFGVEITARAQLHLFWKFMNLKDENEEYLASASECLAKLHNDYEFGQISATVQKRVKAALDLLPEPKVNKLLPKPTAETFFKSGQGFCLKNKQYDAYLYTTTAGSFEIGNVKAVFIWQDNSRVGPEGVFYVTVTEDGSGYYVRGKDLQKYLYIEKESEKIMDHVMAWNVKDEIPKNSTWQAEFKEGKYVALKQNNVIMCGSDMKSSESRRWVKVYEDKSTTDDACLWEVQRKCK